MNEIDAKHYPRARKDEKPIFAFVNVCTGAFVMKCDLSSGDLPLKIGKCFSLLLDRTLRLLTLLSCVLRMIIFTAKIVLDPSPDKHLQKRQMFAKIIICFVCNAE